MSAANVTFHRYQSGPGGTCEPGKEVYFSFACPKYAQPCGRLLIAGKTNTPRNGQNEAGGVAQWDWDGNREAPTFTPSVNCSGCWHGFIENGRCVDVQKTDEPEPPAHV